VQAGQAISTEDARIAAIALTNGITAVTRKTKDFENIDGLTPANPWQSSTPH
jgi:toxin FitB